MSRPFGEGLKYFQVDVDAHDDYKIDLMRDTYGDAGLSFWLLLHQRIYRDSYYLELDDEIVAQFCKKILKKPVSEFNTMLASAIDYKIFDKRIYKKYNILTSAGIQKRYLIITKRWQHVKIIMEYMLDDVNMDNYTVYIYSKTGTFLRKKEKVPQPNESEKKPSEIPQNRQVSLPIAEQPVKEERIDLDSGEIFLPGTVATPIEEIRRICCIPYENQKPKFKELISESNFKKYIIFNNLVDSDYPRLRQSINQISAGEYEQLVTKPIDGKVPTAEELKMALKKLATTGVSLNNSIFLKMQDNVRYVREGKNGSVNGSYNAPSGRQKYIDHSDMVKNKK